MNFMKGLLFMGDFSRNNGYRRGNNRDFRNNNRRPYLSPEERAKREEEKRLMLEQQAKNLQIIADTAAYLDDLLRRGVDKNIKMKEILDYLSEERGYTPEETKVVSQFNYIMMDLANAQKNPKINGNRTNIRVLYLQERLTSSYKKELHESVNEIIKSYDMLFHWDEESNGEGYKLDLETPNIDKMREAEASAAATEVTETVIEETKEETAEEE